MTDVLNDKINVQEKNKIEDNSKPINDQLLQFDDYINTYDNDHKDDNNLLFKIDGNYNIYLLLLFFFE